MGPLLAVGLAILPLPQAPEALTPAIFRQLHREIVPPAAEAWQRIPWRLELLPAVESARTEGKRLFLWSMNGHPLGCT